MDVVEFGQLTTQQRRELEGDEQDPFDSSGFTLRYRPKDRHVGLRDESGRLVASTGMVLLEVEVDGKRLPVVGFGGVIVSAPHRGRGLGREVVQAAVARASQLGPAFAILFCHEDRAGLYRKLGFVEVNGGVVVQQPNGYASMPQRTIALREEATWPAAGLSSIVCPSEPHTARGGCQRGTTRWPEHPRTLLQSGATAVVIAELSDVITPRDLHRRAAYSASLVDRPGEAAFLSVGGSP